MKKLLLGLLATVLLIGNLAFATVSQIGTLVTTEEPAIEQKMEYTQPSRITSKNQYSGVRGSIGINRSVDDGEHVLKPSTI